jgi:Flp pilus assembly protein TadB
MEPAAVLGPAHPLTRAMQAGHGVARQALVVAMTLAAAITASVSGIAWAPAVALAAAVVLAGLGAVALRFRLHPTRRRET